MITLGTGRPSRVEGRYIDFAITNEPREIVRTITLALCHNICRDDVSSSLDALTEYIEDWLIRSWGSDTEFELIGFSNLIRQDWMLATKILLRFTDAELSVFAEKTETDKRVDQSLFLARIRIVLW